MDVLVFVSTFAVGCAALSLWVNERFPGIGPRSVRGVVVHVLVAIALSQLAMVALGATFNPEGALVSSLLALFSLAVPALVYSFLSAIWMIKLAQEMLGRAVR